MEHNGTAGKEKNAVREDAPKRISSPDQLTDYLRVTNPGVWVLLACVVLLLAGILVLSAVGTLETEVPVKVVVAEQQASVIPEGTAALAEGMALRVSSGEYTLSGTAADEYGRSYGLARVELPDGVYDGTVVTEQVHPISFLLESR